MVGLFILEVVDFAHTQGGAKVGLQLYVEQCILVLFIIFHTNNCKSTLSRPVF